MLSRRSFLKALCSVPALASLPAVAALAQAVPDAVEAISVEPTCGVRIAGRVLACRSMSLYAPAPDIIDVTMLNSTESFYMPGIRGSSRLELELYADEYTPFLKDAFLEGRNDVEFVMRLGSSSEYVHIAKGQIESMEMMASTDQPIMLNVHARIDDVQVGGTPSADALELKLPARGRAVGGFAW